tara:strand:+ start:451 stop:1098 length:648 start_codon:yes stop_codon:yes gene_type:complete
MIKYVYEMLQYNTKASLVPIDVINKDKIEIEVKNKSPLLMNYLSQDISIDIMNYRIPGYIIKDGEALISLDELSKSTSFKIHKNSKLVDDYVLQTHYSDMIHLFSNYLTCGQTNYLSLYRGDQNIPLTKNYRETLLLHAIQGEVIIYLFNPKHEKDIKGLTSIKKWSIKVELKEGNLLYIPVEWSYFYESSNDVILSQVECDSYPSYIFNYLRKK